MTVIIRVLKTLTRTNQELLQPISVYANSSGAAVVLTDDEWTTVHVLGVDKSFMRMYKSMPVESCRIDRIYGYVEVDAAKLETVYTDGRKLKDITEVLIKDNKALVGLMIYDVELGKGMYKPMDNEKLRWFMQFADTNCENFYTTKEDVAAKKAEYLPVEPII